MAPENKNTVGKYVASTASTEALLYTTATKSTRTRRPFTDLGDQHGYRRAAEEPEVEYLLVAEHGVGGLLHRSRRRRRHGDKIWDWNPYTNHNIFLWK